MDDIKFVPGTVAPLPADVLAWDNFESGTLTGGQGWIADSIWNLSNAVVTQASPKEGKYCLQINGNGYAIRSIDVKQANARLQFWAKTSGIGTGQYIILYWKGRELNTWRVQDSNDTYRFYDMALASLGVGRGDLQLQVQGNGTISVDDIKFVP